VTATNRAAPKKELDLIIKIYSGSYTVKICYYFETEGFSDLGLPI
jgi:hypothetical protein